ncbi:hypothetical protein N180_02865 [Pedobacter antarcticus 4BY]|uniref:Uncharacterized protein n=2 Tax=Pedobacter antarcticus TaxID=34086 RepID=A0A081PKI4_9SPHI|nr:hypothetical protein [Pedobacter antarcticus]KEQ31207.1 hypothetical protein N180_02865 [Pedobacter antarcticus 4BY]SFE54971.1 hypothetical protein SAMN03003324_00861 [Pedobacter antarcticus]
MRNPERIPIILDLIQGNYKQFLDDLHVEVGDIDSLISLYNTKRIDIEEYWMANPDLRLTQVLVNMGILQNIPGDWYYKEETDYVVEKGFCDFEDVHFWGVNFDEFGKQLPATLHKPLRELDTNHIRAIVKMFEGHHTRLKHGYIDYFRSRIASDFDVDGLINSLKS